MAGRHGAAVAVDTTPTSASASGGRLMQFALLALVAAVVPLAIWIAFTLDNRASAFNDFHDFYYAGKLIAQGHSPYDQVALAALANSEGQRFVVGTGYSYLLPFASAMVPFTWLPFTQAVLLFNGLSLCLFGLTAAAWITWFHGSDNSSLRRRLVLAAAAGAYPSVYGTIANGQANLVLMPILALGTIGVLDGTRVRRVLGGVSVGLSAVVKLVPGLYVVPLVIARRFGTAAAIVLGAIGALVLSLLIAPWAQEGSAGLLNLTDPDPYFANQSINGVVSRLVLESERTLPLWSNGFDARFWSALLTLCFGCLTVGILWLARTQLRERRGLALALGLSLVAGLLAAPKGTYWNQAMLLVAAGLLVAVEMPNLRRLASDGRAQLDSLDLLLLGLWLAGTILQTCLWISPPPKFAELSALVTLATSASTYGMFMLWSVIARHLLRHPRQAS